MDNKLCWLLLAINQDWDEEETYKYYRWLNGKFIFQLESLEFYRWLTEVLFNKEKANEWRQYPEDWMNQRRYVFSKAHLNC